jgi:putative DNA primase/helicase
VASAATIGRNLGGQPQRHNWVCSCPICDYPLSLADGEEGRLLAFCHGGCNFSEIECALVDYGLYADDDYESSPRIITRQPDPEELRLRSEGARWLYQATVEDPLISAYLRSRSISITSPALRFLPRDRHHHRTGIPFPAMTAPVTTLAGEITGVHLSFLKPDGTGLAYAKPTTKGERDRRRQCHGLVRGGAIRLAPHDPDQDLIVGEGVESVLSGMEWHGLSGWSAVSAGGLKTVEIPAEQRRLLIVADNDENGCSQRNAVEAARKWQAEGRITRIWMPDTVGDDANDFLMKKRRG